MNDQEIAEMYGITERTVKNWSAKGVECGVAPPWGEPGDLIEWYRAQYGREPGKKLRLRVAEMGRSNPEELPPAADVALPGGSLDALAVIEQACNLLGLASTLARIVEEEEACWNEYRAAKENQDGIAGARKDWKEATEAKRAVHKTDDAVEVALKLLKDWTRGEWEPRWKNLKIRLAGGRLGLDVRELLLGCKNESDFVKEWDKAFERVVVEWVDEFDEPGELL